MFRKKRNRQSGAITVEVALCLPIFLLLLFGCYEMARANMLLHATESAAYEGARVGILPGASEEEVERAVAFVLNSVGAKQFTVEIFPDEINRDTEQIEVFVTVPFRENVLIPTFYLENPVFTGSSTLQREVL